MPPRVIAIGRRPTIAVMAALVTLVVACGDDDDDVVVRDELTCSPPPARELLLRIEDSAGYPFTFGYRFAEVPDVVLYADGHLLVDAAEDAHPAVMVGTTLPCDDVEDVIADARAAGLTGNDIDVGNDDLRAELADANSTTFELVLPPALEVHVYALGVTDHVSSPARARREALTKLRDDLAARGRGDGKPFEPASYSAYVERLEVPSDEGRATVLSWPLGELPALGDEELGTCIQVEPDDVDEMKAARADVEGEVLWQSGGDPVRVWLRPDLPHQSTCSDTDE